MGQTQVEIGPDSQAEIANGRGNGERPLPRFDGPLAP
jgi:hypothetical protein